MTLLDNPRLAIWGAACVSLFTFLLWCFMPTDTLVHLVEEGQLVENLTLYAYGLTLVWLIFMPTPHMKVATQWSIVLVLFIMMAREADLHKAIGHMSMLKLRFWTGNLPLSYKLTSLLILLPVAAACLYLMINYQRVVREDIKNNRGYAIAIATFISLIFLTNILDRSLGILKETFHWHAPEWLVALQNSQEEFLELSLPVIALVAALQAR